MKGVKYDFTPSMETIVRGRLDKLCNLPILDFPDWNAEENGARPFILYCDASRDSFEATLGQEQPDKSVRPVVYLGRATLPNEQNWAILE